MNEGATEVAKRLIERTLAKDVDGVMALYHEQAVAWRNVDGRELEKAKVRKVIEFLTTRVSDLRYDDIRIKATSEGFVQQHTMRCVAASGDAVVAHACVVARVEGGLIVRIDEYVDSAAMAALFR